MSELNETMDSPTVEQLKSWILELLPPGERMGNGALLQALQERARGAGGTVSEDAFQAARESLLAAGVIVKGQGRGGSTVRPASGDAPEVAPSNAAPNPAPTTVDAGDNYGMYRHQQQAVSRPDVGVQEQFNARRAPKKYRYDSSLAPELAWDENAEREFAEWLLNLVAEAAEKGEANVFAEPQTWKGNGETFSSIGQCVARLRSLTQPFLNWAGKAERQQISVPTVPLFVHERHSTQHILKTLESRRAAGTTLDLFGDNQKDIADQLDAYTHKEQWANRLILGDSLQVMNSLLEYEGMGGQVQMIYMDPPYGVKFGSNFQPFVRNNRVAHGRDEEMIREPEMVKAYRDTWELGLHSYLSYLRDRLLVAKELLSDSGSVFVQISDDNLHHVREVLDEIFGAENCCSIISFKKTSGAGSPSLGTQVLASVSDYLVWYAKDKPRVKFKQLYVPKVNGAGEGAYIWLELKDGERRKMTAEERKGVAPLPDGSKVFRADNLTSQSGVEKTKFPIELDGRVFRPSKGVWKTSEEGMRRLFGAKRVMLVGNTPSYVRYFNDFPMQPINAMWEDTVISGFSDPKIYAVQTAAKVVQRSVLMATDPGDLVLDLTCGSGTTAYVAEYWGRRWITCDTSRVPLALARQRLLTATFPWFELKDFKRGPAGGFSYQRKQNRKGDEVGGLVPRVTLKSIANSEEPQVVTVVDRPEVNDKITRVCGAFTVEATIQAAHSLDAQGAPEAAEQAAGYDARSYLDRMTEILRRSRSLRLPGNQALQLENVRSVDSEFLHAEAVDEKGQRIAIAFGPEDGAISSQQVFDAASEAYFLKYQQLYLFGFAIQAKARELVENHQRLRLPCTYISVTPDVVMDDLLKTSRTDQLFSITGLPDARLKRAGTRDDGTPLFQVELHGLDTFLPDRMETESVEAENLPCWMLDSNYNGMAFCATQVFFPRTKAWDNLQKSLKGQFNESVWDHLAGTESEPFVLGGHRQVAVKVIDERGNELMRVLSVEEAK